MVVRSFDVTVTRSHFCLVPAVPVRSVTFYFLRLVTGFGYVTVTLVLVTLQVLQLHVCVRLRVTLDFTFLHTVQFTFYHTFYVCSLVTFCPFTLLRLVGYVLRWFYGLVFGCYLYLLPICSLVVTHGCYVYVVAVTLRSVTLTLVAGCCYVYVLPCSCGYGLLRFCVRYAFCCYVAPFTVTLVARCVHVTPFLPGWFTLLLRSFVCVYGWFARLHVTFYVTFTFTHVGFVFTRTFCCARSLRFGYVYVTRLVPIFGWLRTLRCAFTVLPRYVGCVYVLRLRCLAQFAVLVYVVTFAFGWLRSRARVYVLVAHVAFYVAGSVLPCLCLAFYLALRVHVWLHVHVCVPCRLALPSVFCCFARVTFSCILVAVAVVYLAFSRWLVRSFAFGTAAVITAFGCLRRFGPGCPYPALRVPVPRLPRALPLPFVRLPSSLQFTPVAPLRFRVVPVAARPGPS